MDTVPEVSEALSVQTRPAQLLLTVTCTTQSDRVVELVSTPDDQLDHQGAEPARRAGIRPG